ncbi:hypothetical protein MKY14_13820 [Paenibacillus sp. FSL R5-0887]|uniref:hypothetical protein n=1 Tax=unclassified Paenibacillus TaxID=185978 RepID=UPI0030F5235B
MYKRENQKSWDIIDISIKRNTAYNTPFTWGLNGPGLPDITWDKLRTSHSYSYT